MIGTESMLLGDATPAVDVGGHHPHVRNDIGASQRGVGRVSMAEPSGADVLARSAATPPGGKDLLRDMDGAAWEAEVGSHRPGNDTLRPVHADPRLRSAGSTSRTSATASGDRAATADRPPSWPWTRWRRRMGYVVGKQAGAPHRVRGWRFDLTGPTARRINVEVGRRSDRPPSSTSCPAPPTVALTMPAGVFVRLAGGRVDPSTVRDQIDVEGDLDLGERIIVNLAFTI